MQALADKSRLVRSDAAAEMTGQPGFTVETDTYIEWETPVG